MRRKSCKLCVWGLLGAVALTCGSRARIAAAAGEPARDAPAFAVRTADGQFRAFHADPDDDSSFSIRNELVWARVARVEGDAWELHLENRSGKALSEVWFPWEPNASALNGVLEDDIVLYPRLLGVAEKADLLAEWDWFGEGYPGGAFAPLVVVSDQSAARMVAAVNWPPRRVRPVFSRGRLGLRYERTLAPGATDRYRALLVSARGDPGRGIHAWHLVLDAYQAWLHERMKEAGLYPLEYPEELRRVHGWMHISLHELARFDADELRRLYALYGHVFPWLQCWGQMSNYGRFPPEGLLDWPETPLEPGEQTGCCLEIPRMHTRYKPALPTLAREITARGGLVGYYARPRRPYARLDGPDNPNLAFLLDWIAENERDAATAFYLDVVGVGDFGDPLTLARMFQQGTFPRLAVTEFTQDVYPVACLVGSCLWGLKRWETAPGQTPADLGPQLPRVTFPRFGRYLLGDRIIFLGRSNGDFMWWGPYRGHDHWTERQVFLLGAKFDAPTRFKGQRGWITTVNDVVQEIVDEWERTGWWERNPVYRDRVGIHDLSPKLDVRRFVDAAGLNLFVVENWSRARDASFRFFGREIIVPPRRLCIMVLPERLAPRPGCSRAVGAGDSAAAAP
jgi:hypothetical protein